MVSMRALAYAASTLAGLATAAPSTDLAERTLTPLVCLVFLQLVSPWWLNKCAGPLNLVLIDLRSAAEYAASHVPGSFSLPFEPVSAWSDMGPGDLLIELPPSAAVRATLGSIGVTSTKKVVLINGVGVPSFPQAASPRVAVTLKYAGLALDGRVAILDGGFPAWLAETLPTTTAAPTAPAPVTVTGTEHRSWLVDIDYVKANINKKAQHIYIIDGRDAAVYNGSAIEDWAPKPGHIPSAVSLPVKNVWNPDGSWKSSLELLAQVRGAVGFGAGRSYGQIIVSCGVGGYAATWYWVLMQVLGFDNVVMYDGSAQEWSKYYDMEL
jgi:thiosulfate/3-mercaptopyruvate sulfurtransferase